MAAFCERVEESTNNEAMMKHGYVTLDALRPMFTTPAWQGQLEEGSALVRMLDELPHTQIDESRGYQIALYNKISLHCLGLLWCAGSDAEKVAIFLRLINPPDQIQGAICNADKDLRRLLRLLLHIATISTVTAAANSDKDMFMPRLEMPIEQLI